MSLRDDRIISAYKKQARPFAEFAEKSFTWIHVERPAYQRHLRRIFSSGPLVRDVGCGSGRVTRFLEREGVPQTHIHGVDSNEELLAHAREQQPDARFSCEDVRYSDTPCGSYDLVTSHMLFQAFDNSDFEVTLEHLYTCTTVGGILFFMVTHPNRQTEFTSLSPEARTWITVNSPWDWDVPNFHRPVGDYIKYTESAGFNIDAVEELKISESAKLEAPERYAKHAQYGAIRFAVLAHK